MRRVVLERGGERATAPPLIEVVARPEGSQVALGEPRPSFTLDVVGGCLVRMHRSCPECGVYERLCPFHGLAQVVG